MLAADRLGLERATDGDEPAELRGTIGSRPRPDAALPYDVGAESGHTEVWVPGSRRHADPSSLLLPEEHWKESRAAFVQAVDRPVDGTLRLRALAGEQAELLERLADVRNGEAVAAAAGEGDEGRLRKLIEPRLPEVDLAELLIEVDGWTGFTEHLVPLSGNRSRSPDMPRVL